MIIAHWQLADFHLKAFIFLQITSRHVFFLGIASI